MIIDKKTEKQVSKLLSEEFNWIVGMEGVLFNFERQFQNKEIQDRIGFYKGRIDELKSALQTAEKQLELIIKARQS